MPGSVLTTGDTSGSLCTKKPLDLLTLSWLEVAEQNKATLVSRTILAAC